MNFIGRKKAAECAWTREMNDQHIIISVRVFHQHKLPIIHEHRTVLGLFNRYDPLPGVANPRHNRSTNHYISGLALNGTSRPTYIKININHQVVPVAGIF